MDANDDDPADVPDFSDVDASIQPVLDRIEENWEDDYERPRGMLTDTDRQFLWGILTYANPQTAANRRQAIRERVENGLLDLFYLSMVSDRDRATIFEQLEEADSSLHSAVSTLVEFIYRGFDGDRAELEAMVANGVWNAEAVEGTTTVYDPDSGEAPKGLYEAGPKDVDVEISIDYAPSAEAIYQRYQAGATASLTPAEIGVLVRAGKLDADDLQELSEGPNADALRHFPGLRALADADDLEPPEE